VYGLGKVIKELQDKKKKIPFTVMSGCMVGSGMGERKRYDIEELRKKTPWVNLYIAPSQTSQLAELLHESGVLSDWAKQKVGKKAGKTKNGIITSALVNVSHGCDNFCTFCVVPYARGREVSRPEEEILKEIKHLILRGAKEVTLCGQNVNSWGLTVAKKFKTRTGSAQKLPFADLLRKICEIEGLEKINFISSNPFDFTQDLIDATQNPKVANYLHIAVQSGNNEVLKNMGRRHTVEEFVALIDRLKKARPGVEIGTDIIVGFPGETREQFMDTVKLFEKVFFNVAFISIYSGRKGTAAYKNLVDDVSLKEKKWRHAYLTNVWKKTKKK
ncbi:MAG: hypothetical protein COW24_02615, partial [Candidatus Kerfeldbacteria bacterium CG15_BIG_FIL_POST_REV_8_21_14_020_45_12]